jgi:hypothetical protein
MTTHFPDQNVVNTPFLINHPQLSVNYHRKQYYLQQIAYNQTVFSSGKAFPGYAEFTFYDLVKKPAKVVSPVIGF